MRFQSVAGGVPVKASTDAMHCTKYQIFCEKNKGIRRHHEPFLDSIYVKDSAPSELDPLAGFEGSNGGS